MNRRRLLEAITGTTLCTGLAGCIGSDERSGTVEALYIDGLESISDVEDGDTLTRADMIELVAVTADGVDVHSTLPAQSSDPMAFELDGDLERTLRHRYDLVEYLVVIDEDGDSTMYGTTRELVEYLAPGDEITHPGEYTVRHITSLDRPGVSQASNGPVSDHIDVTDHWIERRSEGGANEQVVVHVEGRSRSTDVIDVGMQCEFVDAADSPLQRRGIVFRDAYPLESFEYEFQYTGSSGNLGTGADARAVDGYGLYIVPEDECDECAVTSSSP